MLEEILNILTRPVTKHLEVLVASVEELKQQVIDAKNSLQAAIDRVQEDVEALKARVTDGIDPSDLDPISQGLAELKSNLDALDPDPDNPEPRPSEPPEGGETHSH